MAIDDGGNGSRMSLRDWLAQGLDVLYCLAVVAFVVLGIGIFVAAYFNYEDTLRLVRNISQKYSEQGMSVGYGDPTKLEADKNAFEAARSQLLSADAITFLVELMTIIVLTVGIKVFSSSEKRLKKAEEHREWSERRHEEADKRASDAEAKFVQAEQAYNQLALFMGATGASQLASTLASMVDRNLDRLAKELSVSMISDQEETIASVMGDWLNSLKETLTDPSFVEIGIPRPTFNALCERVGLIDQQLKNIDLAIAKKLNEQEKSILKTVRQWLVSSSSPEPRDPIEGARRLREVASLVQTLYVAAGQNTEIMNSMIQQRLLPHELDNYDALTRTVGALQKQDSDLHLMQAQQARLRRFQEEIDCCRNVLREELCLHWEDFVGKIKVPTQTPKLAPTADSVALKSSGRIREDGKL
jgi:hypothetical protein